MSNEAWLEYAHYARRLDEVRAEELARTEGMRQGVAEMSAHADALEDRLHGQTAAITALAATLRFRRPSLTPIPLDVSTRTGDAAPSRPVATAARRVRPVEPGAPVEPGESGESEEAVDGAGTVVETPEPLQPATALSLLAERMDEADRHAREAGRRGLHPALLPTVRGRARGVIVYGIAAAVVLGLQTMAFSRAAENVGPNPIMVLFFLPLVGFGLAYLVLKVGSRTRVVRESPDMYARMGLLMCFLIGPIGAVATVASGAASR